MTLISPGEECHLTMAVKEEKGKGLEERCWKQIHHSCTCGGIDKCLH
jgi:hypothetical protein